MQQFKRPAPTTKSPAPRAANAPNRWADVRVSDRPDPLPPGMYHLRCTGISEPMHPQKRTTSVLTTWDIVEAQPGSGMSTGGHAVTIMRTSGEGGLYGMQRVLAMMIALLGYDSQEAFAAEHDPSYVDECIQRPELIVGREVLCQATPGKTRDDGQVWANYQWAPVSGDAT